jgi:hypothetical protein
MKRSKRLAEKRGISKKGRKSSSQALSTRFVEAAANGDAREVERLLQDERVDPWFSIGEDVVGEPRTALREAAWKGHADVVMLLLKDGRYDHDDGAIVLLSAAQYGHAEVLKWVLQNTRVDPATQDKAVRRAAQIGHAEAVALLLEDPRVNPATEIVCLAAQDGHEDVLRLLLGDPRVDPAALNDAAVCSASKNGHVEVVKLLLQDARVNPAARDNQAVCLAARIGHVRVVKLLLQDARIDATRAIALSDRRVVPVLFEDQLVGIHVNRGLFEKYHPWAVERYNVFCAKKEASIFAATWCIKEIGNGWGDLRYPVGDIMQEHTQNWGWGRRE